VGFAVVFRDPDTLLAGWLKFRLLLRISSLLALYSTLILCIRLWKFLHKSVVSFLSRFFIYCFLRSCCILLSEVVDVEQSGDLGLLSLVQNLLRQYGALVDVDMFAKDLHGTSLITIQPAHPKYSNISQILLDLQSIVGSPSLSLHLRTDSQK
jgi:hypothetical protein